MAEEFERFYQTAIATVLQPVNWKSLQQLFRLKEKRFPPDRRILHYFNGSFRETIGKSSRSKWHRMDKLVLVWVAVRYCELRGKCLSKVELEDFGEFSKILGVPQRILETKWVKLVKPYLRTLPWEPQEQALLGELMQTEIASKWTDIALRLFEEGASKALRTAKQVRERWVNYIDPEIRRDRWTHEDDQKLMREMEKVGKRWSELGKALQRSENSIKNRYSSLMLRFRQRSYNDCEDRELYQEPDELPDNFNPYRNSLLQSSEGLRSCTFRILEPQEPRSLIPIVSWMGQN